MRKWFKRVLLLGLAALPSSAQAQYPAGYYYPQMPAYRHPYSYYYQASPYAMPGYYHAQPMYAPSYSMPYQGAIVEAPQVGTWQPEVTIIQPRPVMTQPTVLPQPQTLPHPQSMPVTKAIAQQLPQADPSKAAPMPELITPKNVQLPAAPVVVDTPGTARRVTLPLPTRVIKATTAPAATPAPPISSSNEIAAKPAEKSVAVKEEAHPASTPEILPSHMHDHGPKKLRFSAFGDYLYWNIHGVDVPYAQPFDGVIPALAVPRGPVAVVSPKYSSGFRVGGEVATCESGSIFGMFTYFHNNRSSEAEATGANVLQNFLVFPNTINTAVDSLTAKADYRIQLMMADLDYRCSIVDNESGRLRWLVGMRYANIDQHLEATFQITGETISIADISFDGFGPRFGLDGEYHVRGGFYGYAQGIVDLLFGQYRGTVEQTNVFTGLIGTSTIHANRAVPVLEFEAGFGWQSPKGLFRVQAGYYVGTWFNSVNMTSMFAGIGGPNFTTNGDNFRDNMTFDGFVLRGEIRY